MPEYHPLKFRLGSEEGRRYRFEEVLGGYMRYRMNLERFKSLLYSRKLYFIRLNLPAAT